jgi:3-dehydroquinate synthase
MPTVNVHLKEHSYQIIIGRQILSQLGKALTSLNLGTDAVVITNPLIRRLHGKVLSTSLRKSSFSVQFFEVPDSEESKSARVAFELLGRIARYDLKRKIFIIAFGGGVIGDLAGFVAAVYKRGIPYIQVPTTFLGQIDSAIGGKVAIDLPVGKNLVGAFYQPRLVYSDVGLLTTLSPGQIRSGLAEAVKYGVIGDRKLFDFIAQHYEKLLSGDLLCLLKVVYWCSQIKVKVVEKDEKETKGIRTILNFGHTIGHALEAASRYQGYQHGEAVALGMRVATDLSLQMGLCAAEEALRLQCVLSDIGLPSEIRKVRLLDILKAMHHDKKFKGQKNCFVLTTGIGRVKVVDDIPLVYIKKAIQSRLLTFS